MRRVLPVPPDERVDIWQLDDDTYAVLLTHEPKIDDEALAVLLGEGLRVWSIGAWKTLLERVSRRAHPSGSLRGPVSRRRPSGGGWRDRPPKLEPVWCKMSRASPILPGIGYSFSGCNSCVVSAFSSISFQSHNCGMNSTSAHNCAWSA